MCCRNCTGLHDPVCRASAPRLGALWGTWSLPRLEEPKKGSQGGLLFSPRVLSLRHPICLSSRRRGTAFPHLFAPAADRKHVRLYLFSKSRNNPLISMQRFSAHLRLSPVGCVQPAEGNNWENFFSVIASLYWLNSSKKSNTYAHDTSFSKRKSKKSVSG